MAEIIVEAALNGPDGSKVAYFFLGDQYVAYDWVADRVLDGVHPITEWGFPPAFAPPGVATRMDAALKGKGPYNQYGYVFKGGQYMRYNWGLPTPAPNPALPSPLAAWGFPAVFTAVDAAFNGKLNRAAYSYFFRGSQYLRYVWAASKVDAGYPKPISNLIGMPAEFAIGVDAAVDGDAAFSAFGYLFKADRYVRFAWVSGAAEPHVDAAIRPILDNWPGLAELLTAGKAKTQALAWIQSAQAQLNAYTTVLRGLPATVNKALIEAALQAHFHVAPAATAVSKLAIVNQILATYSSISATLQKSAALFRYRTSEEAIAEGAFAINPKTGTPAAHDAYVVSAGTIHFTRGFVGRGPFSRAASVLHEAVHVFDSQSGLRTTHIPEWYVTAPTAVALGLALQPDNPTDFATRYDLMTTANALHNPSSFAAFAQHIHFGRDTRFGAGRPD